jgi:hypothetical protein
MHQSRLTQIILLVGVVALLLIGGYALADKTPPDTATLTEEGAKLGPVPFPHKAHADKEKIDCAKCHHKEKDMKEVQKCSACHLPKEVKDNAPIAKDAYHKNCQTCHKEAAEKGKKAPVKCNECHKR